MALHKCEKSYQRNMRWWPGLLLLVIIVVACANGLNQSYMYEENITLERVQSLAPFEVCLPSWLPAGVHPAPTLSYGHEGASPDAPPLEAHLYAEYSDADGNRVMELRQLYTHISTPVAVPTQLPKNHVERLIAWQLDWNWDQVKAVEPNVTWADSTQQDNELIYVAAEITAPNDLRGTVVAWRPEDARDALYVLYSHLPLTTTLDVAMSVSSCENQELTGRYSPWEVWRLTNLPKVFVADSSRTCWKRIRHTLRARLSSF